MKLLQSVLLSIGLALTITAQAKEKIHVSYIPLADHYPAIIAHAKYRQEMKEADFELEMFKRWQDLRGKFMAGQTDVALIINPLAMEMFAEKSNFRFVSLIHRDGNALAVNTVFARRLHLAEKRIDRKPTADVAKVMGEWKAEQGKPIVVAVPSLKATHVVVLYKYLKDHGKTLALTPQDKGDVLVSAVPPPHSPAFLQEQAKQGVAASFEQSLPWAEVVETGNYGKVAWYSKDVLPWPKGHVECIVIATDEAIKNKRAALQEVITTFHRAGQDIETARAEGGKALEEIAKIINLYILAHNVESIKQSLNAELNVINYKHLNVDKAGLKHIMDLAVESGVLKQGIDLDQFTDESFATTITD